MDWHCITPAEFEKAVPIWEKGTEKEMNYTVIFRTVLGKYENALLRIAGHAQYVVKINGAFVWFGPARAGSDCYRVEAFGIGRYLTEAQNVLSIYVVGTNVNSFSLLDKPSFLCAEVLAEGKVLAYTGENGGFSAMHMTERVQKVTRYSWQRTFTEAYCMNGASDEFTTDPAYVGQTLELAPTAEKHFIARDIPNPEFELAPLKKIIERGTVDETANPEAYQDRSISNVGPEFNYKGFTVDELEEFPIRESEKLNLQPSAQTDEAYPETPLQLASGSYVLCTLGQELTGLLELEVSCEKDAFIFLLFDEILLEDKCNWLRMECSNAVPYRLKGGRTYRLQCLHPYALQYLYIVAVRGNVTVRKAGLRRVDFPMASITRQYIGKDPVMHRIYDAAVSTFRQNSFDIYMDCPSRERAGWLCDSFFTSRVERTLTGKSAVERNFLANFLTADAFPTLPEGMLPMCYPSDHTNGSFIPNWAMWFVVELYEYGNRTGDYTMWCEAKEKMYALLRYFRGFENADGMLEKLEKWVFVEWSMANKLVQDINYPTNMLYAKMKRCMAEMYDDPSLSAEADVMKQTIRKQSKVGLFFCDNAVYGADGKAALSGKCTESCQYYAFFTDIATPDEDAELWQILLNDFGPNRQEKGLWPEIFPANAFIGNYLRLDLLARYHEKQKLRENIVGYFDYMAKATGTLWENVGATASCNHGFASHVVCWMDYLGELN